MAVDKCQVEFDVSPGNNSGGTLRSGDADFYLCVYDVRDSESVDYLKKNIDSSLRVTSTKFFARFCLMSRP